ncbi:unnamed protein product [Gongylonema pulchrum]|uniref:Uncharacterized protein n=1 Tax=Gongylonema pulchrum TaxID=637853 RepID=A0A183DJS9_9BILA|nr:unnamed protein product [Gongylonema pulchrum]
MLLGAPLLSRSSDQSARHSAGQESASSEGDEEGQGWQREGVSPASSTGGYEWNRQIIEGGGGGQIAAQGVNREQSSSVQRSDGQSAWSGYSIRTHESEELERSDNGESALPAQFVPQRDEGQWQSGIVEGGDLRELERDSDRIWASAAERAWWGGYDQGGAAAEAQRDIFYEPELD